MDSRLIVIGDIHGCYIELLDLLETISPTDQDIVVTVGDFLDRGPDPDKCIDLWINEGYLSVLGNHDQRLVDWYQNKKVSYTEGFEETIEILSSRIDLIEYISSLPLFLEFEKFDSVVVHAALNINIASEIYSLSKSNRDIILRGRYIRNENGIHKYIELGKDREGDTLWATQWKHKRKVFYGHTPSCDGLPIILNNTYGLDTGCAYGNYLTAAVVKSDGQVKFERVKARKRYWVKSEKKHIVSI